MKTKKKRNYERMMSTTIAVEASQCILAGSNTLQNIELQEVTAKTFEDDTSFPTDGFDAYFD